MDDKLKKIIYIVLGAFAILFIVLILLSSCGKKYTPEKLESIIVSNSKNYYSSHKDELPHKNSVLTLSISDLTNKGIIKELDKMLDKDTSCSGSLIIENNNNYYMYSPILKCKTGDDSYEIKNLYNTLVDEVVTSGNGLYYNNSSYYFRGDKVDNYIMFDGLLWRILKINEDKSIRLIEAGKRDPVVWDDRYNSDIQASVGINNFFANDLNSRIKDSLEEIYNGESVLTKEGKGYIKESTLCIGKRALEDSTNDGSIECSSTLDGQYLGLIQLNEYINASLDTNCVNANSTACRNYNYLADFDNSYWTITANSQNTNQVYKISNTVMSTGASNMGMPRLVINISENTNVSGTGTQNNPYVVSGMSSEIRKLD